MKQRVEKNWFEIRARAAKCDALVSEINRITEALKASRQDMLNAVSLWGSREWAALSVKCGKHPPSSQTITSVLAVLSKGALDELTRADAEARAKFEEKREHAKKSGGRGVLWGPDGRRVDGFSCAAETE